MGVGPPADATRTRADADADADAIGIEHARSADAEDQQRPATSLRSGRSTGDVDAQGLVTACGRRSLPDLPHAYRSRPEPAAAAGLRCDLMLGRYEVVPVMTPATTWYQAAGGR